MTKKNRKPPIKAQNVLTVGKETLAWTTYDTGEGTGWRKFVQRNPGATAQPSDDSNPVTEPKDFGNSVTTGKNPPAGNVVNCSKS